MRLLSLSQERRLLLNGLFNSLRTERKVAPKDFRPIVRLVCRQTGTAWLLSELDPSNPDVAVGLREDPRRSPRIVRVRLSTFGFKRNGQGPVESDKRFHPTKTLQEHAAEALTRWRAMSIRPVRRIHKRSG